MHSTTTDKAKTDQVPTNNQEAHKMANEMISTVTANARLLNFVHHTSNVVSKNDTSFPKTYYQTLYENCCATPMPKNPSARRKINNFLARETDKVVVVKRREVADRERNRCYDNAMKEFVATGNPMVIALVQGGSMANDEFFFTVPHCFNYDEKTKEYYDTTPPYDYQKDVPSFTAFLVMSEVPDDATFGDTADQFLNSYTFITHGDKTHVLVCRKHEPDIVFKQVGYVGTI